VSSGCLGCVGEQRAPASTTRPPGDAERLVRATLAAYAVALVGGPIGSEYVGATIFEYLGPFVVGVLCGAAATRAAHTDGRDRIGRAVRGVAAGLALCGVAFSFLLERSQDVLSARAAVLLAYLLAVAGALLWTMPPRHRPASSAADDQGLSTDV
jgi:hypothetical protein